MWHSLLSLSCDQDILNDNKYHIIMVQFYEGLVSDRRVLQPRAI